MLIVEKGKSVNSIDFKSLVIFVKEKSKQHENN